MAKCRHKSPVRFFWDGTRWTPFRFGKRLTGLRLYCGTCGTWLPLGPSNDDSPEVRVEMRAAELAAIPEWWCERKYEGESYGALCYSNGGTPGDDSDGGCSEFADDEWAGYLARAIVMHDEEVRDGDA